MNRRAIVLAGAGPGTGNLGVDALRRSVLDGLSENLGDGWDWIVLGHRSPGGSEPVGDSTTRVIPAFFGAGVHRHGNLVRLYTGSRFGWSIHPGVRDVRRAVAVCDISGGDSFTDLYGPKVFAAQVIRKRVALDAGIPLVLLPQTFGPFRGRLAIRAARDIVTRAAIAWARDEHSFATLRDLLGSAFDPARHRLGVDVAFLLRTVRPSNPLDDRLREWLGTAGESRSTHEPVVGINVSGLIHNDPEAARRRFGIVAEYPDAVRRVVEGLIDRGARVVLVPHVMAARGTPESDEDACDRVVGALDGSRRDRLTVAPALGDPRHAKWIVSQLDWFCGTRMHATIAGLSSGVPTATISYSGKALGVFESCGMGSHVHDPRSLTTDEIVARCLRSFEERAAALHTLAARLPHVLGVARDQIAGITEFCRTIADARESRQHPKRHTRPARSDNASVR